MSVESELLRVGSQIGELSAAIESLKRERDEWHLKANGALQDSIDTARDRDALAAALDNLGQYEAVSGNLGDGERLFIAYRGDPDIAGVVYNPQYEPGEAFEEFATFLHDKVDKTKAKAILREHDEALVKPLVKALTALASHSGICASRTRGDPPCDCGLDAALAPYRKETPKPLCSKCGDTGEYDCEHRDFNGEYLGTEHVQCDECEGKPTGKETK